ncbi:hypothetical protein D3C86_1946200 [compost metagenome]
MVPIIPEAPARFSSAIGWPSSRAASWQMMRIERSAVPPAGQGQMKVMGRSGKSAANTRAGAAVRAAALRPPSTNWRRANGREVFIVVSDSCYRVSPADYSEDNDCFPMK